MTRRSPLQLHLFADEWIPLKPTGPALAEILVQIASLNDGWIHSTPIRRTLVEEGLLQDGQSGRTRLYRALSRYGRFNHVRHGVYRLNPDYKRKAPPQQVSLTAEQAFILRRLRSYDSEVAH